MPYSVEHWTPSQWGVFVAVVAAGVLAALLAPVAVRVRADVRKAHRPARLRSQRDPLYLRIADRPTDELPDVAEHVAPGPGSLATLREVGPGAIAPVEPLVDADIREALGEALDRAVLEFRTAVEPAMRKARLWTLQGGETYAVNALRTWHIMEITGEYPLVQSRGLDGARA